MCKISVFILASLMFVGGCNKLEFWRHRGQPYLTNERYSHGLVIVLTGIEGRSDYNEAICKGLDQGGVTWGIELYDWTSSLGYIYNLRAESRNRREAQKIADRIAEYQMAYPDQPVVLVGQSGGGALAAWVAEAMPVGHKIDGVVMLAASLSPGYRLDGALANCDRGIVNFYSNRDVLMLGLGTTVVGTMDGEHTSSAGRVGFEMPYPANPGYRKLFQVAWQPEMANVGNNGLHLFSGAEKFVSEYVAPFVLSSSWDEKFVAAVLGRANDPGTPISRRPD